MRYGNQLPSGAIMRAAVMALVGWALCVVSPVLVLGMPLRVAAVLVTTGFAGIMLIVVVGSAIAYSESIGVENGRITLFVFGQPMHTEEVSDLVAVERRFRSLFPVVFRFRSGSRI